MGKLFEGSSETVSTQNPYESNPWEPQQDFLKYGFNQGQSALDGALAGLQGKDLQADLSVGARQDLRDVSGLGRHQTDAMGGIQDQIRAMLGQGPQVAGGQAADAFGNNATKIMNGAGAPQVGNTAKTALDVAKGLTGYNPNVGPTSNSQAAYGDVSQNKLNGIVGGAQSVAEDPYVQGNIDAALKDVNKAFLTDRGGLNTNASATGNINSSRAGVLEGRMADDAMDRAASISAGMRSDAYNKGLDVSAQAEALRQGSMLTANNQIQGDDQLRLGAADLALQGKTAGLSGILNAGQLQLGDRSEYNDTMLTANDQIGQQAQIQNTQANDAMGRYAQTLGLSGAAYDQASQGLKDSLGAHGVIQEQKQAEIAAQLQKLGLPMDMVQQYMATIGGSYGGEGFNTTSQTIQKPSMFQQLVGGAATAASLL